MRLTASARLALLAGASLLPWSVSHAQTAVPPATGTATVKQVFTPADFTQFAPKTAYEMLVQVPGFTIRSADSERGLGQASENVLINGERIAPGNVERIEIVDA
jgi:hypothetical protein